MRICDYCHLPSKGEGPCPNCQSASFDSTPVDSIQEGRPFHYNGYVVWWLANWMYDVVEYLFYLGDTLVERFTVSREVLRMSVPEHQSERPFIWDLFLIAQGEEEVLRIVEQNTIKPVTFKITVKKDVKEHETLGLSSRDVYEAIARSKELEHAIGFYKGRPVIC